MEEDSLEKSCECEDDCSCNADEGKSISLDSLDDETKRKIQELQMIEQNLQQFMMQKQAFSMELDETKLCLTELEKSTGEVFKIVGGKIVVKSDKDSLVKEMNHKKDLIELRLKNMTSQEEEFIEKTESLRGEIIKKISGNSE